MKKILLSILSFFYNLVKVETPLVGGYFVHATIEDGDYMTLMNVMQTVAPDGSELAIAEEMENTRNFIKVAPWTEANGQNMHFTGREVKQTRTLRSRRINRGNTQYITDDEPHREEISFFEDMVDIDEALKKQTGNFESRRAREQRRHIRDMADGISTILFYGNAADAENEVNGIATRYNALSLDNVKGAGGTTGSLTSLYMIEFDQDFCSLIYPKGHKTGGVEFEDFGKQRLTDSDGNPYMGYSSKFNVSCGLNVTEDDRIQRLCNIQVHESSLGTDDMIDQDNMNQLVFMKKRLPSYGSGKMTYIFANRDVEAQFEIWADTNSTLCQKKTDLFTGLELTHIKGIPVLVDDSIVDSESVVS